MADLFDLSEFVRISHYAIINPTTNKIETYEEQVDRVLTMHKQKYAHLDISNYIGFVRELMIKRRILGSQRALQFGGAPILKTNARMYNCAATYIDRPRAFQEVVWLWLCGTGVGCSVQKQHVSKLPAKISKPLSEWPDVVYYVTDDIEGWADAFGILISSYIGAPFETYTGMHVVYDYSRIRPKGSKIANILGTAPGPAPLQRAIEKCEALLRNSIGAGEKLRPIHVYDLLMHMSDAVLSGGIRRSASIFLFSEDDEEMMSAKTGSWYIENPQRARSNNSIVLLKKATTHKTLKNVIENVKQFGEPGFILVDDLDILYNPCSEIGLYAKDENGQSGFQMCNLCEINMAVLSTRRQFYEACEGAAILGTLQAGYTDFKYLGGVTESIVKREALLGVSMTGMMDNPELSLDPFVQQAGADIIRQINKLVSKIININQAARTTCVKPAGSTSCLLGTASGIHPHHSRRYFRRVQVNEDDELLKFFTRYNPHAVHSSAWSANGTDKVITFSIELDNKALTKDQISGVDLLKKVKLTQKNWVAHGKNDRLCVIPSLSHNVSNTITVKQDKWEEVIAYIYKHKRFFSGVSLLSETGDRTYRQAPFQAVYTTDELVKLYGDGLLFATELISSAKQAFNGSLYDAVDCLLGTGEKLDELKNADRKRAWIEEATTMTSRYFATDLVKMSFCLKDVDALKNWCESKHMNKPVPWHLYAHKVVDFNRRNLSTSCDGGACDLVRV